MRKSRLLIGGGVLAAVATSVVAVSAPWDLDMVDGQTVKGFECWEFSDELYEADDRNYALPKCKRWAEGPAPGTVSQANVLAPHTVDANFPMMDARWNDETSPWPADRDQLELGEEMFRIYCSACHGKEYTETAVVETEIDVADYLAAVDPELNLTEERFRWMNRDIEFEDTIPAGTRITVTRGWMWGTVKKHWAAIADLPGENGRLAQLNDGWVYGVIRKGRGLMPAYGWAMSERETWAIVQYSRLLPFSKYTPPEPEPTADADEGTAAEGEK